MKKKLRAILAGLILVATIGVFIAYLHGHPALIATLGKTNPLLIALLLAIYIVFSAALVLVLRFSLLLYDIRIAPQESFLLNAYSSLANFFGPGQSGPAFRALYLKKRHGLSLKSYLLATLLYYGFYAVISVFLLLVGSRPWWQTGIVVLATGIVSTLIIRRYASRSKLKKGSGFNLWNVCWLGAATALQIIMQAVAFFIELRSINPHISLNQILTYTGAANLALFASITPGAIGIREAFLVFTGNLHHIANATIVTANVIDRGVYLLLLGLLFIAVLTLHAKDKLHVKEYTSKNSSKLGGEQSKAVSNTDSP